MIDLWRIGAESDLIAEGRSAMDSEEGHKLAAGDEDGGGSPEGGRQRRAMEGGPTEETVWAARLLIGPQPFSLRRVGKGAHREEGRQGLKTKGRRG
jgi:hypothetical protein